MQGKTKVATCWFLGMLAAGLLAQPELARSKTMRGGKKFTAVRATSAAVKPVPAPEAGKVILMLETRDHRVTVHGSDGKKLRYSVATLQGIALAEGLSASDLKDRFPDVHEVVTGIAWAGALDARGF